MKSRYLLSAGAALAVAFGGAGANAQFAFLGGPYPVACYMGPEGGWTQPLGPKEHGYYNSIFREQWSGTGHLPF